MKAVTGAVPFQKST